jgi:triosephosphate isomerase
MGKRRPFIAGNWKMNLDLTSSRELASGVVEVSRAYHDRDVMIAPPFPYLLPVKEVIGDSVFLGAQNCYFRPKGAYTGEVSCSMLRDVGCTHVILGHSERRQYFREDNATIHQKVKAAIEAGLVAVLCVGETLEERTSGKTFEVVGGQLEGALAGLGGLILQENLIVAYEPVWAIGTGRNALPSQAQEVHGFVREWLSGALGREKAQGLRILYGGSVTPENIDELMAQPDIDGALVGGASLDRKRFGRIIGFIEA